MNGKTVKVQGNQEKAQKLPWWAREELPASLIIAAFGYVILAIVERSPKSVVLAGVWVSITVVFFLLVSLVPRFSNLRCFKKGIPVLVRAPLVGTTLCQIVWSPLAALTVGLILGALGTNTLEHIAGLWLVVFGLIRGASGEYRRTETVFEESFDGGIGRWGIESGDPRVEVAFGNPAPSLLLPFVGESRLHSSLCLPIDVTDGEIQCDVYLRRGVAIGILFRGQGERNHYYVARLSADPQLPSALLRSEGVEGSWHVLAESPLSESVADRWCRLRVVFHGRKLMLFADGDLIVSARDKTLRAGWVGAFNERGQTYLDNFRIMATLSNLRRFLKQWIGLG